MNWLKNQERNFQCGNSSLLHQLKAGLRQGQLKEQQSTKRAKKLCLVLQ